MNHHTTADSWDCYNRLPEAVQKLADAKYRLLRSDPRHPSLHFKRVGRLWSVRVGIGNRALAVDGDDGPVWFWIGTHAEYDRILQGECVLPLKKLKSVLTYTPELRDVKCVVRLKWVGRMRRGNLLNSCTIEVS